MCIYAFLIYLFIIWIHKRRSYLHEACLISLYSRNSCEDFLYCSIYFIDLKLCSILKKTPNKQQNKQVACGYIRISET